MRISKPKILWGFCCLAKAVEQLIATEQRVKRHFGFLYGPPLKGTIGSPFYRDYGALLLARSPSFQNLKPGIRSANVMAFNSEIA